MPQVRCHRFVLDDGSGDQLGEHGDEGAEVHHVALDRCVLPVHVDGIAHGLEGIERDADGQRDAQLGQINVRDQGQIGCDEVPVLEKAQKITDWATNHRAFLSSLRNFSTSRPWV